MSKSKAAAAKPTAENVVPMEEELSPREIEARTERQAADEKALASIVEKIKECADFTNLRVEDVCECLIEPVLDFGAVYRFGNVRKLVDGSWTGEVLLMNGEGGCVLRSGFRGDIISLRESVEWFAGRLTGGGGDFSSEPLAQEEWYRRIAERMSAKM